MKRKKVCLNFKRDKKEVKVFELNFLEKGLGLMLFRKNLLFNFKKPSNYAMHSFFCPKFYAVWTDDKFNVIEIQLVKPWRFSVKPKKSFSNLIEIPVKEKNKWILKFLVGSAKGLNTREK